jgi:hypothetical protein
VLQLPEPPDLHAQGAPERRHAAGVVPKEESLIQRRAANDGEVGAPAQVLRLLLREERLQVGETDRLRCAKARTHSNITFPFDKYKEALLLCLTRYSTDEVDHEAAVGGSAGGAVEECLAVR